MTPSEKVFNALERVAQGRLALEAAERDVVRARDAVAACEVAIVNMDVDLIKVIKSAGWSNKRIIDPTSCTELCYDDEKFELLWTKFDGILLDPLKTPNARKKAKGPKAT